MNRIQSTAVLISFSLTYLTWAADITVDTSATGPIQGTSGPDTIVIPSGALLTDMGAGSYVVYGNWGEDHIILRGGAIDTSYSGAGSCAAILMRDYQQTPLGGDPALLRQSQYFTIEDGSINIVSTASGTRCHGLYQDIDDVVGYTQVMNASLQGAGSSITTHGDYLTYGVRQEPGTSVDWAAVTLGGANSRIEATSDSGEGFGVYQSAMLANSLDVTLSGANTLVRATGAADTMGVQQSTTGHQNGSPSEGDFNVTLSGPGSRIEANADTGNACGVIQHTFWATETGTTLSGAGSRIFATSNEGDACGVQQIATDVDTTHVSVTGHGAQIRAIANSGNAFGVWQAAGQSGPMLNLTGAGSSITAESQNGHAVGILHSYGNGATVNIGAGTTVSAIAPQGTAYAIFLNSTHDTISVAGSIVGDIHMDGFPIAGIILEGDVRPAGNDTFHLQRGARIAGTVNAGGSDNDALYIDGGYVSGTFVGFENVYWSGALAIPVSPNGSGSFGTMTLGVTEATASPGATRGAASPLTTVTVQSGGGLAVYPTVGFYRQNTTWAAGTITATGGFSGQPALRAYTSPMLTFAPRWNNGLITVSVTRSSYATYADNDKLGLTLDRMVPIVGRELQTALTTIDFLPTAAAVSSALNQLDPSSTANGAQSGIRSARHFSEAVGARVRNLAMAGEHVWNVWGVQDQFRDHDGDYDTDAALLSAGADRRYGDLIVGLAVGYGDADGKAGPTDIESDGMNAGLYMAHERDNWILDGMLFAGTTDTESERSIAIGTLNRTATAQYDTMTYGASLELQRQAIQHNAFSVRPAASVVYLYSDVEDIREEGAGASSAHINGTAYQQLIGRAGVLASYTLSGEHLSVSPRVGAAYFHSFLDGDQSRASFDGYYTYRFDLEEQDQATDWGTVDAGIDTTLLDQQLAISLTYTGYFGDDYTGHAYSIRASYAF